MQYNYCYYCYSQGINVFFSFYLTLFSIGEMQPVRFESTAPPPPLPTDTIAQIGREGGGRRERRGRAIVSTREGNKIQPRGERREKSSSQTDKGKHGCNGKTLFKTSTCTGEDALVVLHIVGGNARTLPQFLMWRVGTHGKLKRRKAFSNPSADPACLRWLWRRDAVTA